MPRRAAGGSLNSPTASRTTRRCTKPAFPATRRPKIATLTARRSSTKSSGGGWTSRRPAWSSSRRRAPGARSNSARPLRRQRGSGKAYPIVSDIVAARDKLVGTGIEVGEFFHIGPEGRVGGLDPERRTCRSRALFNDPDGNVRLLQEITTRLPGRIDPDAT
jgi:hypothetical protein